MPRKPTASYADVQEMAEKLHLSTDAYRRAIEIAQLVPDRDSLLHYIDRFLIVTGAVLIVVGIAVFFAWNWVDLGPLTKFAMLQCSIVAAVILAWRFGLDSAVGRVSLFAAAFLTGTFLAVFGQVYQTGADPYGLFLGWATLILPWAVIGRQAAVWMLLQILLNLTVIMYYTQVLNPPEGWWQLSQLLGPVVWLGMTVMDSTLASYLFALNAAALVLWEIGARHGVAWMRGTVFPRLIALLALSTVVIPTLIIIAAAGVEEQTGLRVISPVLMLAATGACLYYYRYQRRDLFILTCSLLGTIMVVTSIAVRFMLGGSGSLLLLAVLVIAQVAGAAWWLRQVAASWEVRT